MADKNNKNGFDSIVRKKFIYIGDVVTFIKILKSINFKIYGVATVGILLAVIEVLALLTLATFVSSVLQQPTSSTGNLPLIGWFDFSYLSFTEQALFCLFMFALRFVSGLLLQNYILLQSSEMQTALRRLLFQQSLRQRAQQSASQSKASGAMSDLIVRQVNLAGKGLVEPSLRVLGELVIMLGIIIFVLLMSPLLLALLVVIIAPVVMLYIFKFRGVSRSFGDRANESLESIGELAAVLSGGWRQLTVRSLQSAAIEMVTTASQRYAVNDRWANIIASAPRYFLELFLAMFLILALLTVNASSAVNFAELVFLAGAGLRLLPIVTSISNALISFQFNRAVLTNIVDVVDIDNHVMRGHSLPPAENIDDYVVPDKNLSLTLRQVSFGYEAGNELLSNITVSLEAGDFMLIAGKSGVGKTTLMDIICGARLPTSGSIIHNGVETSDGNPFVSKLFYVPQQPLILPGTILGNVMVSDGSKASEDEINAVLDALSLVGLSDVFGNVSDTVNANVGPDGDKLSGGQKQRLVLARALYHGAEIFALDEVISGLESASKRQILKLMKKLAGSGKIVVMISHDKVVEKFATKILNL
ncbi:ABC transporter ATP-binding protein/permease [Alphaproteobacteria bacterium]|nr:ABC transporter ATP-binding protein/permease [Alphaproteobacteria bacterium]